MQSIFLDIPASAVQRIPILQSWLTQGQAQVENTRQQGYSRLRLQAEQGTDILALLEDVTFQESVRWILREEQRHYQNLLGAEVYPSFQQQAQQRILRMEPQLRTVIGHDLERLLPAADSFNVNGYLRFSARKLKRLLRQLLREEYQQMEEEMEQEEFVELLRFFVSVQPPLLDCAYLTIYGSRFTLTDEWGNDLRQIYLDSLLEEEITGVSDNDLLMSILITLLPAEIHLEIKELPPAPEFLELLRRVFGEQLIWHKAETKGK